MGQRSLPNLTPHQAAMLDLIKTMTAAHPQRLAPTMQEMADRLGVSKVTVFEHLKALEKKGRVSRERHKSRSVQVIDDAAPDDLLYRMARIIRTAMIHGTLLHAPTTLEELQRRDPQGYARNVLEVEGVPA